MQPQTILLYRRRWTVYFQLPFVIFMALSTVSSMVLAVAVDQPLLTALCGIAAFVSFCIAWTLGRSAWEAYQNREPAVIIDAAGITDLRADDEQPVPWGAMERVQLDNYENRILIRLRAGSKESALGVVVKALQRWQRQGDVVIALAGLAYHPVRLQNTLRAFHQAAAPQKQPRG